MSSLGRDGAVKNNSVDSLSGEIGWIEGLDSEGYANQSVL